MQIIEIAIDSIRLYVHIYMKSEASLIKNNPKKGTCREKSTRIHTCTLRTKSKETSSTIRRTRTVSLYDNYHVRFLVQRCTRQRFANRWKSKVSACEDALTHALTHSYETPTKGEHGRPYSFARTPLLSLSRYRLSLPSPMHQPPLVARNSPSKSLFSFTPLLSPVFLYYRSLHHPDVTLSTDQISLLSNIADQ